VAANFDKDGNFLYNLVIVEDITGRKQVEDDLKKSKEQLIKLNEELEQRILDRTKELTDLYDKAPCGYHSLDKDGLFLQINETELKMLGYTREELIQKKNFADLITAESQEKFKINFPLFKKMGFIKDLEFDFIRKDKTIFPILLSATAVYDSENNYLMSRSTLIDNTDLKQAKDEILKAKTTLEAVNKELETFTYSVSHDLKAPLRGIDGYSKLLSELYANQLNEEAKHFITTIRSSTMQMNQLIDDLLKYSRLERSQLQIQPLKIRSVIESILKMNEDEIVANDFSVQVDVPEIKLIADLNGIQIALRNLIENAIKFTKKATNPEILIKLAENQDYWIISVSDNGIGFDMKYSERIFEIFQRLQRAEDYPGTGIGLAMVAKTMQRMNGKVRAESKVGQGSTFYLEISKTNQQWN
jgi:PAS domain S-box-containing protein